MIPSPVPVSLSRILVAERFAAPVDQLSGLLLPLDVIASVPPPRLRLVVIEESRPDQFRMLTLIGPSLDAHDTLHLSFAPFENLAGASFIIGAVEWNGSSETSDDLRVIAEAASHRPLIVLTASTPDPACLFDDRAMTVNRVVTQPDIRTAHWIDVYWSDASGIHLSGWVHAFQHRVHAIRFEAGDRSARVEPLSDRPDLLQHYPEHRHVRFAGFSVYLACRAGQPVSMILETDGGEVRVPFELPEGPQPPWGADDAWEDELSPALRRFAAAADLLGGRVLQIGSRVPWGAAAVPPRAIVRRLIGVDIHPGCNVDIAGDAAMLSRFIRNGSIDGVFSSSVLEHIETPWTVAAEINRVLRPGGLVYHQVPSAWPAHAQPNDFWRFSAEGLRVLFGAATGFEVMETAESAPAMMIPAPAWRQKYLDMPSSRTFAMAEIVARKTHEVEPGAVTWPASAARGQRYPVDGLRPQVARP